jgi:hypothetical protein
LCQKVNLACRAFSCTPYFAIVIDAGEKLQGFLVPMEHLTTPFALTESGTNWKMIQGRRADGHVFRWGGYSLGGVGEMNVALETFPAGTDTEAIFKGLLRIDDTV